MRNAPTITDKRGIEEDKAFPLLSYHTSDRHSARGELSLGESTQFNLLFFPHTAAFKVRLFGQENDTSIPFINKTFEFCPLSLHGSQNLTDQQQQFQKHKASCILAESPL